MWVTSTIILFILLGFAGYLLYQALNRITQYENYILEFEQIIRFATEKMRQVDSTGHYESDDEVGFFFEQLKDIQTLLNELFEEGEQIGPTTEE
jgi:hypothetical protein|tara:strand:+ start:183 stop:464 length:282 start_codon:yes stop_codon:yes gene_type:complete